MKRVSFLLGVVLGGLFFLPAKVWAQTEVCPNINFSYGTLQNWQCYMGGCSGTSYWVSPTSQLPGKIDIMNRTNLEQLGQLYDPYCSSIPKIPDGFEYSCRVGNSSVNAEVDAVEYTLTVDSNNSLLMIGFAWVMEYPVGHPPIQQPQMIAKLKDASGQIIAGRACNPINFISDPTAANLACRSTTGPVNAMDWIFTGYSLEDLIGQTVKIYFETYDCTQGGHFGYGYIVCECRPMRIEVEHCKGSPAVRMVAPDGFLFYEWTRSKQPGWRDNKKQINISNPMDGEVFTVTVTNNLGCTSTLKTEVMTTEVIPHFQFGVKGQHGIPGHVCIPCNNYLSWYDTCSRTATFVDLSSVYNSEKSQITWTISDLKARSTDSMWTYMFPNPDTPTTYLVKLQVEAKNWCADTSNPVDHYITIFPSPIIKIDGPTEICQGDVVWLKPIEVRSKYTTHHWSYRKSDGTTGTKNDDSLLINGPGTYYLMSIDTNGCYAYDTLVVTALKPIIQNLNIRNATCYGAANGQFSHGNITGGKPPFSLARWTIWDNTIGDYRDSNIIGQIGNTVTFREQKAGTYTFYGEDNIGCVVTTTITITQPDSLQLFPTPKKTTCEKDNGAISFVCIGGVPPYTISITGPATKSQPGVKEKDTVTISGLPKGAYTATIVDANNCESVGVLVEVEATPYPSLSVDTIITAKCGINDGQIKLNTHDAPRPHTFVWSPYTNSMEDTLNTNWIIYLKPGQYILNFKDGNGCPIKDTFYVDSFRMPTLDYVVHPEVCHRNNGEIILTKVTSDSPDDIVYEWYKVPDTTTILNTTDSITDLLAGKYRLKFTDLYCEIDTIITIPYIPGPIADFTSNTYTVPINTIFTLTGDSTSNASKSKPITFNWDLGDGNQQTVRVVRYSYGETGDYRIFLEVIDVNSCTDTISKWIHVYDELHVYIPNAFSPNDDGLNEKWKPIVLENAKEGYMLSVYDRWGQRVFHTTDSEAAWDGTIDGKPAQNNTVYSYRLIIRDFTGQEYEYIGHVSIIK